MKKEEKEERKKKCRLEGQSGLRGEKSLSGNSAPAA
jgi:hypothetical protein